MKDFVISIILFSLLISLIIGNSLYINNEIKLLNEAVKSVPEIDSPECQKSINFLRDEWQRFKKIARLSLNYSEINRMDCLIEEMNCHLRNRNVNDFENSKVMILNLLGEIVRLEEVSVDGIF